MSTIHSQQIVPFLWFDGKAEEAIHLYTSLFPSSEVLFTKYWGPDTPFPANWVSSAAIVINGLKIYLFDAGPQFTFNESVSFFVTCKDQSEIDLYWETLTADGGKESQCGWLKDRFGFSWQIVPEFFTAKMIDGEPHRIQQMMQAMMTMRKFVIAELETAYYR